MFAAPATAQQGGAPVLRSESSDQLRQATPDIGVRRAPTLNQPPAASPPGNGVSAPAAPSELSQATASPKALSAAEAAALAAAFKAADDGRYGDARAAVANFNNPLLVRIVDWTILRTAPRSDADFASTWRFLRDNPDWPEPEVLRRQAEDRIIPGAPAHDVWRYFIAFPPLTSAGHMRRLEAATIASPKAVPGFASDSWRIATFRKADEEEFLNKYGRFLSGEDHIVRFDRILRSGRAETARDLVPKLPPDYQPLANARLAMATRAADATTLLRDVPAAKLSDPAIKLEMLAWLRRTGKLTEAKALALQPPPDQSAAWWNERQQLARDLLAAGHPAEAYAVTMPHGQTKGVAFAEAEFLAGWIALRRLKKTSDALKHFQTLYDGAPTDAARGRGAYWLGRAHETAGRSKEALEWFGRAAAFGQTFYGQLAARRLPGGARQVPSGPATTPADQEALAGRELVAAARYIGQAGEPDRARPFLLRLARQVTAPGETLLLAELAAELKRPDVALTIARRATDSGVILFDALFPVVDLGATGSVERALALALARQESGFNAAAVSSSGALGLMQLLPTTAREVAGKLSLPFVQDKLTSDPAYNVTLGSQYLAQMLQRFGGSYEIALAAYNAGPNRVARLLDSLGDPRTNKIDMVDWIEMIPLRETRNYVQRIMEGLAVYRERLNGPFRLQAPATGRS
ncbi:transglycosylase SLT domain-containing protein [Reyranella sp.]|uniref:lytic transglycosylase domain-containing protein n=1 Tax=Reyranella sp. TaxID=1929291 RepID=UPI003D121722